MSEGGQIQIAILRQWHIRSLVRRRSRDRGDMVLYLGLKGLGQETFAQHKDNLTQAASLLGVTHRG